MVQLVDSFFKNLMVFDWTGTVAISIYITLGLVYILAHILNRKTECVILWGWWDVTLIFITVMIQYLFMYGYKYAQPLNYPRNGLYGEWYYV